MEVKYYPTLNGERLVWYDVSDQPIDIGIDFLDETLEVAIGIDPSSTTTGFTMGRVDQDYPFLFIEFRRKSNIEAFTFLKLMSHYIVHNIVANNNIRVKYIFSESIYEGRGTFSRNISQVLSTVKKTIEALPSEIRYLASENHKDMPDLKVDEASSWRKVFLKEKNTNAKRNVMKAIVTQHTMDRYNYHPNIARSEDLIESIAIYSAGFEKYIEPTLKSSNVAVVNFDGIEWNHHTERRFKFIGPNNSESYMAEVFNENNELKNRVREYGLKVFEYESRNSLEKNIRGLTSFSNAVFMCISNTWNMDNIPIYYELKKIPRDDEVLAIFCYRKNIKEDL